MARTNAAAVAAIMAPGKDYDGATDLAPFVETAGVVVDRLTIRFGSKLSLNSAEMERIECWLAAHFYCCSDRTYRTRKSGAASGAFDGSTGMGFDSTMYGQTAKLMDPSGGLAFLEMAQKAPMIVGGFWGGGGVDAGLTPSATTATAKPVVLPLKVPTVKTNSNKITGTTILVNGTNFGTDISDVTIDFNLGAVGHVVAIDSGGTQLTVEFDMTPTSPGDLMASVTNKAGTSAIVKVGVVAAIGGLTVTPGALFVNQENPGTLGINQNQLNVNVGA